MNTTTATASHPPASLAAIAPAADLAGRAMLALIFLLAGASKITGYEANLAYMASVGVPGFLLPGVIALEILGGLALIAGFQTRLAALGLAIFSVASAVLFHMDLGDQMQFIMFFKNIAMAGGLLIVAAHPLGQWTVDRKIGA